ncbi:hypothetical protein ACFLU4_00585 [Chloroflexota bacterium]
MTGISSGSISSILEHRSEAPGRVFVGFFSSEPKLSSKELDECKVWLGKHYELRAFQTREANLHNIALFVTPGLGYAGNYFGDCRALLIASHRQVQAAKEIISRMDNIKSIPEAAAGLHIQWRLVRDSFMAYSSAIYAIFKSVDKEKKPNIVPPKIILGPAMKLLITVEDARKKAEKEDKKFLKRMINSGFSKSDIKKLMANAEKAVEAENWQP